MKKMSGAQAAVEALKIEEVGHVFGLIGSATIEMFDALYDTTEIKFIGVRDERTGTHMADGYARASGSAGVILAGQNGPGTTNLVTGLAQAKAAYSPVVALAGSLATGHVYRDAFQEVDQETLFKPITKKTWTVPSVDRVPEMMREAFRTAMTPRRGPVQVNLPRDVLSGTADFGEASTPAAYRNHTVRLSAPGRRHRAVSLSALPRTAPIGEIPHLMAMTMAARLKSGGGANRSRRKTTMTVFQERFRITYLEHLLGVGRPIGGH